MSHVFKPMADKLHVIAVISNPVRYHSRINLYKQFERHMSHNPDVVLWTVETAFGDRPFEVTDHTSPHHLQLRTAEELWHKENMINLGIQRLPADWKYVAWIDADLEFLNPNWAQETLHELQHHQVVQLFQHAIDMGPRGEVLHTHQGFCVSYKKGLPYTRVYGGWHPGYAWAATRSAINALGGLIDFAILGAGDDHMAKALIGKGLDSIPNGLHPSYTDKVRIWQDRADACIKRDIGYVQGTIKHWYHGQKKNRKYWDRWKILTGNGFNPESDIKRDWQGLWQLTDRSLDLRDGIRRYFRERDEDGIDG